MGPQSLPDPKVSPLQDLSPEEFWEKAYHKTRSSRSLFEVTFELTYGCNLRCVHCYNPTHVAAKEEMTTEKIVFLFKEFRQEGCLSLILSGGEMFTRRDFFGLLTSAKEEGFSVTLKTNGTFITEAVADRLQSLLPLEVNLSLYGATKETYERVTRIPGSFAKCVFGIEQLIKRRVPLTLILPTLTLNVEELGRMREMAKAWGVRSVASTVVFPRSDGSLEPFAYRLDPEQAAPILREPFPISFHKPEASEKGEKRWKGRMHCEAALNSCAVTPYGKMNLCTAFPLPQYDLLQGSVREGWLYLRDWFDASATKEPPKGKQPNAFYRGCPADGWLEKGELDAVIPYYETLALIEERLTHPAP